VLTSVGEFVKYFEGVRRRTRSAIDRVTPALADYRPRDDEWTCGAIVRHLAGAERFFVTKVLEDRFTTDLEPGPATDWDVTKAGLEATHHAAMAQLACLPDAALSRKLTDLDGGRVSAWRFLMAMVEHEVHHRSQLDSWVALAGAEAPQLYGYRMEDVVERAKRGTS
jgi:uncharacterized damage-inducible protein DinB